MPATTVARCAATVSQLAAVLCCIDLVLTAGLCNGCAHEGIPLMAAHESGCKQWPGNSNAHRHQFCFACTRPWGGSGGCGHGNNSCTDPGIQQLRQRGDTLEVGHINGPQFCEWILGNRAQPPPTVYPSGQEDGSVRQQRLNMTNPGPDVVAAVRAAGPQTVWHQPAVYHSS